jgi:hypothetical protein
MTAYSFHNINKFWTHVSGQYKMVVIKVKGSTKKQEVSFVLLCIFVPRTDKSCFSIRV